MEPGDLQRACLVTSGEETQMEPATCLLCDIQPQRFDALHLQALQ